MNPLMMSTEREIVRPSVLEPSLWDISAHIRRSGHALSAERRAVVEVLLAADEPLDGEQVLDRAREAGSRLSRTTAWRALLLLTRIDVAEVSARRHGRQVFRLKRGLPSIHMVRTDTGMIDEIHDSALAEALQDAARRRGYKLSGGVELRVTPLPPAPCAPESLSIMDGLT